MVALQTTTLDLDPVFGPLLLASAVFVLVSLAEVRGHLDDASGTAASLSFLHELGLVVKGADGRHEIASEFFRRWLVEGADASAR